MLGHYVVHLFKFEIFCFDTSIYNTQFLVIDKKILMQSMKLVPKPNFSNVVSKKLWFKESKAFSISVVTK